MQLPLEDDPRPPYVQAAEVLRRQIQAGALKPGEKLPSARELQAKYGIASSTVQNALRVLKHEGLIYSVQGRGSFVRSSAEAERQDEAKQAPEAERQGNEQGPPAPSESAAKEGNPLTPGPSHSDEFNTLARGMLELHDQMNRLEEMLTRITQRQPEK
ncbi:GntR family transcriptional regulator [Streptomyces celluloflavus]|uniref:Winged helix-turn-helix domain-containing protein n=1 Tax=Streptomyces celluloflavus TaxID=58344 RepID=A0ABW7R7M0_9ACTN|nr:winged helix-turn-helix domain-containing protein [Streptomyces celluloflavus]